MTKKFQIETIFSANDRVSATIKKISNKIKDFSLRVGKPIANAFAPLTGRLTRDAKAWYKVGTSLWNAGNIAVTALSKVKGMVEGATGALDQISKASQRTGATTDAIQEIEYAVTQAGGSFDGWMNSLEFFNKNLGKLKAGQGELLGFLKQVSPAMLKAVAGAESTDDALNIVFEGLSRLHDPAKRAAFAVAAFGDEGAKIANAVAGGYDSFMAKRRELHDFGLVIPQSAMPEVEGFNDQWDTIGRIGEGAMRKIGASVAKAALPQLIAFTDWVKNNSVEFGQMLDSIGRGIVAVVNGLVSVGKWFVENKDWIGYAALTAATLYMGSYLVPMLHTVSNVIGGIGKSAKWAWDILAKVAGFRAPKVPAPPALPNSVTNVGAAAGGSILGRIFGVAAKFARVAGPIGAIVSAFDAQELAPSTLDGRKKGAFEDPTRGLRQVFMGGGMSDFAKRRLKLQQDLTDRYQSNIAREVAGMLGVTSPAAMQQLKSQVVIEFKNAPQGMVVREIATQSRSVAVDVQTRRGRRQLDPLGAQ